MRIVAVMVIALSGCSFVFVNGPPAQHEQLPYFDCTESRVVPVLDTIFTVLQGANFIFASGASDERWADNFGGNPPIERSTAIPIYAVATLLGIGGAYYGYTRTGECRDAKERAMVRMQNGGWQRAAPYAPQPYAPQPGPYAPQPGPYAPQPAPYAPQPAPAPYPPAPAPGPYAPPPPPPNAPSAAPGATAPPPSPPPN